MDAVTKVEALSKTLVHEARLEHRIAEIVGEYEERQGFFRDRCFNLNGEHFYAFLRMGMKRIYIPQADAPMEEGTLFCLTVANIQVAPGHQNKGIYSKFLKRLENLCYAYGVEALYIENVLIAEHCDLYVRRGFARVDYPGMVDTCYFKPV